MRLIVTTFVGVVFGFFIGVSFPTLSLTKVPKIDFYLIFPLLFLFRDMLIRLPFIIFVLFIFN